MLKFTGDIASLPPVEGGESNGQAFDVDVIGVDANGGTTKLAPAGVLLAPDYYEALNASVEPFDVAQESVEPEKKGGKAPKENKSITPPENK